MKNKNHGTLPSAAVFAMEHKRLHKNCLTNCVNFCIFLCMATLYMTNPNTIKTKITTTTIITIYPPFVEMVFGLL